MMTSGRVNFSYAEDLDQLFFEKSRAWKGLIQNERFEEA
jgi:hypothetical protein